MFTNAAALFSLLGSAVIVAAALGGLIRAIIRVGITLRDNIRATNSLSDKLDNLSSVVDGRIGTLEQRVNSIESALISDGAPRPSGGSR